MGIFNISSNMTNFVDVATLTNDVSGGFFGQLILIVVGVVSLAVTSRFNAKDSMVSSAFIIFTTALFLRYLGLINPDFYLTAMFLLIVGVVFAFASKGGGQGA